MELPVPDRQPRHHHVGVSDGLYLQTGHKPVQHQFTTDTSQLDPLVTQTHLVDVKVIDYGVEAGVQIVEQRDNLQGKIDFIHLIQTGFLKVTSRTRKYITTL